MAETWVINENPFIGSYYYNPIVNFVSDDILFTEMELNSLGTGDYGSIQFFTSDYDTYKVCETFEGSSNVLWYDSQSNVVSYINSPLRFVTFETTPTGDLLTWLEANAVKQTPPSTKLTFDLSTLDLPTGTYNVKVLPKGDGVNYRDADLAECVAVEYTVASSMPVKGQIITMDLGAPTPDAGLANQYRVLSVEGNVAYVVAMFDANTSCEFNTGGCFEAGSKILVSLDGVERNIEDLKQGDTVISYNVHTGEFYEAIVKSVITNDHATNMARITTENTVLEMTAEHPLLTTDGWKSLTGFGSYPVLAEGDMLVGCNGNEEIKLIERYETEPHTTYTMDVIDEDEEKRGIDDNTNDNFVVNRTIAHNPPPSMGSNVYNGGELDTYLNSTWYSQLSATAHTAIQQANITQYEYSDGTYHGDTHASYADYSTKSEKETGLSRYVYAMDVEDIEAYFGGTFSTADIWEMFWNVRNMPSNPTYPWLRSASALDSDTAFFVGGFDGYVGGGYAFDAIAARPAFKIDLSKVTWS